MRQDRDAVDADERRAAVLVDVERALAAGANVPRRNSAPSLPIVVDRISRLMMALMAAAAPSDVLSTTLPVKPSVTTTSTSPAKMSRPST